MVELDDGLGDDDGTYDESIAMFDHTIVIHSAADVTFRGLFDLIKREFEDRILNPRAHDKFICKKTMQLLEDPNLRMQFNLLTLNIE